MPTRSTAPTDWRLRRRRSNSSFHGRKSTAGEARSLDCSDMINLLDFDQAALAAFFAARGEKPFRTRQVLRWVHHVLVDRVEAMTDLAKATREALARDAEIRAPVVLGDSTAADGTRKWLLDVGGGNAVEAVYIPESD